MNSLEFNLVKNDCIFAQVPILKDRAVLYINELIKKQNVKKILEIGTAYGFSALSFLKENKNLEITTIEKNPDSFAKAKHNFLFCGVEKQVTPLLADAIDVEFTGEIFDLIFIDGPKAQYLKYFERFQTNLKKGGLIVCDNISFHKLNQDLVSKNTAQLLKKLEIFKTEVLKNKSFKSEFLDIADGLLVSKKLWNT